MLKRVIVGSAIAAASWATYYRIRRWWATWGVDVEAGERPLPGDDLITEPSAIDTRVIDIAAPPEAIWPWLVQMGYGRGGWYSYDQMDMKGFSADEIVDAWQNLAVGDIVPTHPDGGFKVAALDPGRALVLYSDTELVARQAAEATSNEPLPGGLKVSGAMLSAQPQRFAASWAFVVEPAADGSRLFERFRVWFGGDKPSFRFVGPVLGFGVFVMMQRQMVGIRARAERLARKQALAASGRAAVATAGHETTDVAPAGGEALAGSAMG